MWSITGWAIPFIAPGSPWEAVADVARRMGADVVVPQSRLPVRFAQALARVDTRVVICLRNIEADDPGGDPRDLRGVSYATNSQFTANRCNELFGVQADVVHPLIRRGNYQTETTRENVTFINPHPRKGVEIA